MTDLEVLESKLRTCIGDWIQMGAHPGNRKIRLVREFTLGQIVGIQEAMTTLGYGDRVEEIHRELAEEEARPERQIARTFLMLFPGRHLKRE